MSKTHEEFIDYPKRPRNKRGRFVKHSPLGNRYFGVKLFKKDQEKLIKVAKAQGIPPAEMIRSVMGEWLKSS